MKHHETGFTLIEVLVAAAVLGIILSFVGVYMAQQSRVTAMSQAINEAEVLARGVAEVVLQDLQNAGARAVFVDGATPIVRFASVPLASNCLDVDRSECVVMGIVDVDGDGSYVAPRAPSGDEGEDGSPEEPEEPNAMTILYRSSLDGESSSCRQIDIAWPSDGEGGLSLLRSDVTCGSPFQPHVFAENVTDIVLQFVCSNGDVKENDPGACYVKGDDSRYVRQAEVSVTVTLDRRDTVVASVTLTATTPNLRPRIDFLRDLDLVSGGGS